MLSRDSNIDQIAREIAPSVRVLQVIHLAILGGLVLFFMYQLYQGPKLLEDPKAPPPLLPLAVATLGAAMSFVVPWIMRRSQLDLLRGQSPIASEALTGPLTLSHVVGLALLEGPGLLAAFSLGGAFGNVPRWFLVIPIALIAIMAFRFPRLGAVARWVEAKREELSAGI